MPALEAIVLAGGFGTRLREVVQDVPKPLAPVAGRPFLAWLMDGLQRAGVSRTILATGYLSHLVEEAIGSNWQGMDLAYSVETTPLGTGGAIRQALARSSGGPVLVLNGDTWLGLDAAAFAAAVTKSGLPLGMALANVPDVARYGAVGVTDGRITAFGEKSGAGPGFINAGVYCLARPAELAFPPEENFSFEKAVLAPAAAAGRVAGYTDTRDFIDIGIPEDYARAQQEAARWLA